MVVEKMNKHAYLIMAHDNFEQLIILINELDYIYNDIFLHIDKKNPELNSNIVKFFEKNKLKQSSLYIIKSISVHWGGFSQIKAELLLIEQAMKEHNYTRLHLLSAVDFPIKSQKYIYNFFEKNANKEFIMFDYKRDVVTIKNRVGLYHPIIDKVSRKNIIANNIEKILLIFQKILKIDRTKTKKLCFMKGANWFSITGDFANYVLDNKNEIENVYKKTKCCDEIFLQTLAYNSKFKDNLYFDDIYNRYHNLRYIDWKRGNPYIFRENDINELLETNCLFARKFDIKIDSKILELIIKKNKG